MKFELKTNSGFFLMPCKTISVLQSADEISLKVLICLYSSAGYSLDEKEICETLLISKEELQKAIAFLCKKGLLNNESGTISLCFTDKSLLKFMQQNDKPPEYSFAEIEKQIGKNESMKNVFNETQSLLGKPLSPSETKILFSLFDWLSLPPDVVLMCVSYCVSIDKKSLRYIEKTALDWADKEINTHEKVALFLEDVKRKKTLEGELRKFTGIGERALTTKEKEYINKWTETFKYNSDIIKEAYERTVDNTGKLSFQYMDKILCAWHENKYTSLKDIKNDGKKPAKQKKPKIVDTDELEQFWLNKLLKEE